MIGERDLSLVICFAAVGERDSPKLNGLACFNCSILLMVLAFANYLLQSWLVQVVSSASVVVGLIVAFTVAALVVVVAFDAVVPSSFFS